MARLISDIVQTEIIDKLDGKLKLTEVLPYDLVSGTQLVKFCTPKWLALYNFACLDNDEAKRMAITGPDENGYYAVQVSEPNNLPAFGELTTLSNLALKNPLLFVGTLKNTKVEWAKFSLDEKEKLPFIWLTKPTAETFNGNNSSIERTSNLVLWFVHWSDWTKLNADREDEAVKPLFELVEYFTKAITKNTATFKDFDNFETQDYPKLATESPNGVENMVFDSTLSGVSVNISVDILVKNCNNC